jgi:hypothetical protein
MNIVKWEMRKRIAHLRWIVLPYLAVLAILFLLPASAENGLLNVIRSVLGNISILLTFSGAFIVTIYPTLTVYLDLRSRYWLLEKMHGKPFAATVVIRTALNTACVLLGSGLLWLASKLMEKFSTSNMSFMVIHLTVPYEKLLFDTAILSPAIALLAFTAALSIPILKKYSAMGAVALYIIGIAAVAMMPDLSLITIPIAQIITVLAAFAGSCWLYEKNV